MALSKKNNLDNTFNMLDGMTEQVKESKSKQRKAKAFKKPRGDYYNLDMVIRKTVKGSKGHPVLTEEIKTDYREYISLMAEQENISITKYIHRLIDKDMKKNKAKYEELKEGSRI
jgi:hypothetical protein